MNKRGISNVLVAVLLVLLAIVLISIVWVFISIELKTQGEVAAAKNKLIIEKYEIKDITGDLSNGGDANAILARGSTKIIVEDITVVEKRADIVFIVDSTASMGARIREVSKVSGEFVNKLSQENINSKLALIEFRDYTTLPCGSELSCQAGEEQFVNKIYTFSDGIFTGQTQDYIQAIKQISQKVCGGGDEPEAHLTAIKSSFDLPWDEGYKKIIILLTDITPHAKDCITDTPSEPTYPNVHYLDAGAPWAGTMWDETTFPLSLCYQGPEYVQDVTDELVEKGITFYYINNNLEDSWCHNRIIEDKMTSETGGKFYTYDNVDDVQSIIDDLAKQIIANYRSEGVVSYLYLVFYNDIDAQSIKIENPPLLPYETKKYEIVISLTNVKKAELYPVIVTPSGKEVIGPLIDVKYF